MITKLDIPQFMKDQLRKQTISPEPQKQNFHRRFTSSQMESAGSLNSNNQISTKQSSKKMSMHGLQQLLRTSPYNKAVQLKAYSQMLIQESFSQQYLKDASQAYTPNQQPTTTSNFFKKGTQSQNSTMSSSVKQRMRSANKDVMKKKPPIDSIQLLSNREKDKQTISQLQDVLLRTNFLLQNYRSEIARHIQEKEELVKLVQKLQSL